MQCIFNTSKQTNILWNLEIIAGYVAQEACLLESCIYFSALDYRYKLVLIQALSRVVSFPANVWGHHAISPTTVA